MVFNVAFNVIMSYFIIFAKKNKPTGNNEIYKSILSDGGNSSCSVDRIVRHTTKNRNDSGAKSAR